ncbi:hypothetical protein SAMN02745216_01493 [Desulfatibacillum alkenivorans DSM 16219]|jgi:hypothetical protein|uniref:Esterase-like activity of phytase n=1 Tax=Desulfatibacillum alkenivorans DSM 16219 TaxID=1121393 RepID=A0A1M6IIE3_9BACT|nr:hypothetical protein [Desulfatibacillum alkenivorans]SHJ34195.1 hypothetical protein SAMN02745216_01493 [Desulfatibacillum alkenivorans DSM 16219]
MQKAFPLLIFSAILFLLSPAGTPAEELSNARAASVKEILLKGPASSPKAEFSGMDWHMERLILLPQYPEKFTHEGSPNLFAIPKTRILSYLNGTASQPIRPEHISFDMESVKNTVEKVSGRRGWQGFEAMAFSGDKAVFSIEAYGPHGMLGFLVRGRFQNKGAHIVLDKKSLTPIPMPVHISNKAYEAMFIAAGKVYAIYEANGLHDNPSPQVQVFDISGESGLSYLGALPFPPTEYRITDITAWSEGESLTAVNYYFPGDKRTLDPVPDPKGPVEQLVFFLFDGKTIAKRPEPPRSIINDAGKPRNWEGIVQLDDAGYLLVTDKWPKTILAFVPR